MRYAVIYQSATGNTRAVAEHIYQDIPDPDKGFYSLKQLKELPRADVYLVGFGVQNMSCGIRVIELLEQITSGKLVLFATCGCPATEKYRQEVERKMEVWLPEGAEYLGMFLCQGSMSAQQQALWRAEMPSMAAQLQEMFDQGSDHPNQEDFRQARQFIESRFGDGALG